jgi:hypothetical protein
MVKVNLFILMEIFMKENGVMIWLMEGEFICIQEVLNMRENGKMIYKMDMELRLGLVKKKKKKKLLKNIFYLDL